MSRVPQVSTETIGPKEARKYLMMNTHNRVVRRYIVAAYARDMLAKRWYPAVDVISFDWNGVLLNGQHTLLAVVEASQTAKHDVFANVIVVRDQDPDAQDVMDTQPKRSAGDQLGLHGEVNSNRLAAAIRLIILLETFGSQAETASSQLAVTTKEVLQYLDEHPTIRDSVPVGRTMGGLISASIVAALHYLMSNINSGQADEFWTSVENGTGLQQGDPVFALRRFLITNASGTRHADRWTLVAMAIKAWNAYRAGKRVGLLIYKTGEEFPVIK
jgi:hypothetical protein